MSMLSFEHSSNASLRKNSTEQCARTAKDNISHIEALNERGDIGQNNSKRLAKQEERGEVTHQEEGHYVENMPWDC